MTKIHLQDYGAPKVPTDIHVRYFFLLVMKIKKLSICHVNVRSLLAQTRLLELGILTASHSIDVLCLSETWLSADRAPPSSNIMLPGFQLAARRDRAVGRGGGVAIYVRNGVAAAPLPLSCSVECVGV